MKRIAPILISSVLSAFLAVAVYQHFDAPNPVIIRETLPVSYVNNDPGNSVTPGSFRFSGADKDFVLAANNARESVVAIRSLSPATFWTSDDYSSSSGSGVILSEDGYIATNKHVIDDAQKFYITLNDQREFEAEVVGKDAATDLALLKVDATDLQPIQFGNSDSLDVGAWVLAIGNPFRLRSTVTAGIVSAKGRNISILPDLTGIESFIQTDAAVNPGNSGGALVNTRGELVGINTAIMTYSGQYEGFSFAVPSNLARKILRDLRVFGSVQRGWLGVVIRSVDNELAESLGLDKVAGVYLDQVHPSSAANAGGLRKGDVIVGVDGLEVDGSPKFMEQVAQLAPGDELKIDFIRDGRRKSTDVTLSRRQNAVEVPNDVVDSDVSRLDRVLDQLGLEVRELSSDEQRRLKTEGLLVESIENGSKIDKINMETEYIITSVNGKPVSSVVELVAQISRAKDMVVLDGFYENYPGEFPYAFYK